jgi:hypothetical protein
MYGKINFNTVNPQPGITSVTINNKIATNGQDQILDNYGIIKSSSTDIIGNVIIPSGTNGVSAGAVRIGAGYSVTVQGDWRIV